MPIIRICVRRVAVRVGVAVLCGLAALSGARAADTILFNGRIVTLDGASSIAEAIAIAGPAIEAVGSSTEIRRRATSSTRSIDLGGRTVIPGLIDSHIHAIRAGLRFGTEISWIGASTIAEAMARIAAAAKLAGPGQWLVVAGGWTPRQFKERRLPTRAELEAAAGGHPAYVQLFYGAALLTRQAKKQLGIGSQRDVPPKGRIERDSNGGETGWISGDAPSITRLYARLPQPTLAQSIEGTKLFFRELNRVGLTGVIDPGGYNLAPEQYEALFALWRQGGLTVRIAYSICAPKGGEALDNFQTMTRFLPMGTGDDWLRFNGIGERVTWGMNNNRNPTEAQKAEFVRIGLWAARRGMSLTMHWPENDSVHHLLEAFERINREVAIGPLRWSVAHLHDATPASLRRIEALGVGWLMQNRHYFAGSRQIIALGDRVRRTPPLRTAIDTGMRIGAGTDAHRVMDFSPFVALRWMLDGLTVEGVSTRGPAEKPSREQALKLYTQGSAWFAHDENRRGTLAPGRLADLAVLSADYFSVPVHEIGRIESSLTMVGGKIVHAAPPFRGPQSMSPK